MAGLQTGMFLADEDGIRKSGCEVPETPEEFNQAMAMMPMVSMMVQNMNGGVEPAYLQTIKEVMH